MGMAKGADILSLGGSGRADKMFVSHETQPRVWVGHHPAFSSTFAQPALELMGFSVTYWLMLNSALKILHMVSISPETRSHL